MLKKTLFLGTKILKPQKPSVFGVFDNADAFGGGFYFVLPLLGGVTEVKPRQTKKRQAGGKNLFYISLVR
jgi:hypothetical protein